MALNAFVVSPSGAPVVSPVALAPPAAPARAAAATSSSAAAVTATGVVATAVVAGRRRQRNRNGCNVKRQVTVVSEAGTQAGERPKEGKPLKVIVAGGGVGGLTSAFAMLKKGWDVKVFDTKLHWKGQSECM
eukprot:Skav208925  [mRNA]  locus=scaffold787:127343:127738:+ [translate_table: standard]